MNTLGLIPARGSSKGVPRKNARLLCGRPLLHYTAEAALGATRLSRVVLSTEDETIASIGLAEGLDVPFLRPAELAEDTTPMLPVVQHALRALARAGEHFDAVCLLQPTSPLRGSARIDQCLELLEWRGADSVVTVLPVPTEFNPHWVFGPGPDGTLEPVMRGEALVTRRQDLPPAYCREGSVYAVLVRVVLDEDSLYGSRMLGVPVDPAASVNIDTIEDWRRAETLLGARAN